MKKTNPRVVTVPVFLFTILIAGNLWAAPLPETLRLIDSLEEVRKSMAPEDPSVDEVSLRLADLYFEKAKQTDNDPAGQKQAFSAALERYRSVETSKSEFGLEAPESKEKLEFQIGRTLQGLDRYPEGRPYLERIAAKATSRELKREAALAIAEQEFGAGVKATPRVISYFTQALGLCGGTDLCWYLHYRRGWGHQSMGRIDDAVIDLTQALRDKDGNLQEESLRDLISFLAAQGRPASNAIQVIDPVVQATGRMSLLQDLGLAYLSANRREEGVKILAELDRRQPTVEQKVALLEEYYGQRDWDQVQVELNALQMTGQLPANAKKPLIESTLKRVLVQLEGELKTSPQHKAEYQAVGNLLIGWFGPGRELVSGWLAVEQDESRKLKWIEGWLERYPGTTQLIELSAISAQKTGDLKILAERARQVALSSDFSADRRREMSYASAKALYDLSKSSEFKKPADAIAALEPIADPARPDKYAIQAEHLLLDVHAQTGAKELVLKSAEKWLSFKFKPGEVIEPKPDRKAEVKSGAKSESKRESKAESKIDSKSGSKIDPKLELGIALQEYREIYHQARFELAVSSVGDPAQPVGTQVLRDAQKVFLGYCDQKKFLPKSCENYLQASVRLKDQLGIIAALEKLDRKDQLAAELERAGYFDQSARLVEKLSARGTPIEMIRIALLYELGGDRKENARILRELFTLPKFKTALDTADENLQKLAITCLQDYVSDMESLGEIFGKKQDQILQLKWPAQTRGRLAEWLWQLGVRSSWVKKTILDSPHQPGPAWAEFVKPDLEKLNIKQSKTRFYGQSSRWAFQKRVRELTAFSTLTRKTVEKADPVVGIELMSNLRTAVEKLAQEVLATPIPKELPPEALPEIREKLQVMAKPFQEQGSEITQWIAQQEQVVAKAKAVPVISEGQVTKVAPLSAREALQEFQKTAAGLAQDPDDRSTLEKLKAIANSAARYRWVSYLDGRIQKLSEPKASKENPVL